MSSNIAVFAIGVVTGMFIAQRYNVPDVKRLGTKVVKTGMQKLKEWEKNSPPNSPKSE
jgi:hypothetical protein